MAQDELKVIGYNSHPAPSCAILLQKKAGTHPWSNRGIDPAPFWMAQDELKVIYYNSHPAPSCAILLQKKAGTHPWSNRGTKRHRISPHIMKKYDIIR